MITEQFKQKLERLFIFNVQEGKVIHKYSHDRVIEGQEVGWIDEKGYRRTKINGDTYFIHKLIWLHAYGEYPDEIDHKDGDPGNNTLENLRVATRTQNLGNANFRTGVSGTRGVHLNTDRTKWRTSIQHGGRAYFLGDYDTIEEAAAVYQKAQKELYGEFAFCNRPPRKP